MRQSKVKVILTDATTGEETIIEGAGLVGGVIQEDGIQSSVYGQCSTFEVMRAVVIVSRQVAELLQTQRGMTKLQIEELAKRIDQAEEIMGNEEVLNNNEGNRRES